MRCTCARASREARELAAVEAERLAAALDEFAAGLRADGRPIAAWSHGWEALGAREAAAAIRAMQSETVIVRGEARDAAEFDPKPKGATNPWS